MQFLAEALFYIVFVYCFFGSFLFLLGLTIRLLWLNWHHIKGNNIIIVTPIGWNTEPSQYLHCASSLLNPYNCVLLGLPFVVLHTGLIFRVLFHTPTDFNGEPIGSIFLFTTEAFMTVWPVLFILLWQRLRDQGVKDCGIYIVALATFMNLVWLVPQLAIPAHPLNDEFPRRDDLLYANVSLGVSVITVVLACIGGIGGTVITLLKPQLRLGWWLIMLTAPSFVIVWLRREYLFFGFGIDAIISMMIIGFAVSSILIKFKQLTDLNRLQMTMIGESINSTGRIILGALLIFAISLFIFLEHLQGVFFLSYSDEFQLIYNALAMVVILMLILLIIKIISLPIDIWNWLSFLSLMLLTIELSHIGGNWSIEIRDSLRVAFHMGMVQRYTIIGIVAIIWLGLTLVFNRGAILRPFLVGVIWAMLFTSWMSDEVINSSTEYLPIYVWAVPSLVLPIAFAMMTWVFVPGRKGCEVSRLP